MSKTESRKLIRQLIKEHPEMIIDFIEAHSDFTNNLNYELQKETALGVITKSKKCNCK